VQSAISEAPPISTRRTWRFALTAAYVLVSLAYLVQCATPLRLINDGVDYLLQASSALDGHGFLLHGARSMRPPGYPALIFAISKVGLGTSWAIVALNCLMLGIGIWVTHSVLRRCLQFSGEVAHFICLMTLLSYLMVRNAGYPLSDISYFGLATPCLLILARAEEMRNVRRWGWLALALPLMFLCIEVRTIGIVLIPAFLWAAIGGRQGAESIYPILRRYRLLVGAVLILVSVAAGNLFYHSRYMQFNLPIFLRRGMVRSIIANVQYHTTEWGELTANAPLSKLPPALEWPMRILGACAIAMFVIGIWARRRQVNSLLLYVIGGACIVFGYPWFDTRLWLPIIPFLMGYMLVGCRQVSFTRPLRALLVAYFTYFCLLGCVALGYSTRITFAGSEFPQRFGDGNFRPTYRLALLGEKPERSAQIDADALYILRRFEPRARK
jgi:hypothetical protein